MFQNSFSYFHMPKKKKEIEKQICKALLRLKIVF